MTEQELIGLCALYGITGSQREHMLERARTGGRPNAGLVSGPVWAGQLTYLTSLEAEASHIDEVSTTWIPGLLQTPDYVRAVINSGNASASEKDWLIRTRLGRQSLVYDTDGPALRMIIDQFALYRPIGGTEVMSEQLDQLHKLGKRPNVTIQVISANAGAHVGLDAPFTLFEFPERETHVYIDARATGVFLTDPDSVSLYREDLALLEKTLLDEDDSRSAIDRAKEELSHE